MDKLKSVASLRVTKDVAEIRGEGEHHVSRAKAKTLLMLLTRKQDQETGDGTKSFTVFPDKLRVTSY